jgi:hypothetical protein
MSTHTLNDSSYASIPGKLIVSRKRYVRYYEALLGPRKLLELSTFIPYTFSMVTRILYRRVRHWVRTQEHLQHGCLCPSVVIDHDAGLVATFTNLIAADVASVPVIRITRERLDMIPQEKAIHGTRLVSVALFSSTPESLALGRWSDFSPIVAETLIEDTEACDAAFARLSDLAWLALDMGVKQLSPGAGVGLYPVEVPHEIA